MKTNNDFLLNCESLKRLLKDKNIVLLDCTMKTSVNALAGNDTSCIPGAISFSFDQLFDVPASALPHTLPDKFSFEEVVSSLGIENDSTIVLYDRIGIYSSPRVWWMFLIMGHRKIYVLDGGLPQWIKEGGEVSDLEQREITQETKRYVANFNAQLIRNSDDILKQLDSPSFQLLDARAENRFNGMGAEPRPGLRSGHVPGAKNLPFSKLVDGFKYKHINDMRREFDQLNLAENQTVIYMCGSGVTACILALAGYGLGYQNFSIYDGSWSEWGGNSSLPISV
jgi:thiosulfate/3-mercaptopyruvate sulfurtransferase